MACDLYGREWVVVSMVEMVVAERRPDLPTARTPPPSWVGGWWVGSSPMFILCRIPEWKGG